MDELERVMQLLVQAQAPLPPEYADHPLKGAWADCRDCHIRGDWVLIYRIVEGKGGEEVIFVRTGTHSELFE
jgi:mRNA interferase YafQ